MKWIIRKGDPIFPDTPKVETFRFVRKFTQGGRTAFRLVLVAYSGDEAPSRLSELPSGRGPEARTDQFSDITATTDDGSVTRVNLDYDLRDIPSQQLRQVDGQGERYFVAYLDVRIEVSDMVRPKLMCGTHEWLAPPMLL